MKLIHVGSIIRPRIGKRELFLRKVSDQLYTWFESHQSGQEIEMEMLRAHTVEEAIRLARHHLKTFSFRTLSCGFRYTLPERDEHGINALFWQMAASYSSPGGIYFDEEVGHNCFVQNSSHEALKLCRELKEKQRI